MKKPTVHYDAKGQDGNIYALLANAERALRNAGHDKHVIGDMKAKVTAAQDYDEALKIIGQYVTLRS